MYYPVFFYVGAALQELSKDKIVMKNVESNTAQFLKTIENIETGLSEQINYLTQVSTGQFLFSIYLDYIFIKHTSKSLPYHPSP